MTKPKTKTKPRVRAIRSTSRGLSNHIGINFSDQQLKLIDQANDIFNITNNESLGRNEFMRRILIRTASILVSA